MTRTYAQITVDDLYAEGDRDYHFLAELFANVDSIYTKSFGGDTIKLNKTKAQQFEDVLKLAEFFIDDGAYEGFYMPVYGEPYQAFKEFPEFQKFLRAGFSGRADFFEVMTTTGNEYYSIGLAKVRSGAKAPPVTQEVEQIFVMPDSGTAQTKAPRSLWEKTLSFFRH